MSKRNTPADNGDCCFYCGVFFVKSNNRKVTCKHCKSFVENNKLKLTKHPEIEPGESQVLIEQDN